MILEDFYKLNFGQEIYYKGHKYRIDALYSDLESAFKISLYPKSGSFYFLDIMADLSFDPPKARKRHWRWQLKDGDGAYYATNYYVCEDGFMTNGQRLLSTPSWGSTEKIKIEDGFIDI